MTLKSRRTRFRAAVAFGYRRYRDHLEFAPITYAFLEGRERSIAEKVIDRLKDGHVAEVRQNAILIKPRDGRAHIRMAPRGYRKS